MSRECYEVRYDRIMTKLGLEWDSYTLGRYNVADIKPHDINGSFYYEVWFDDGTSTILYNVTQSFYREKTNDK